MKRLNLKKLDTTGMASLFDFTTEESAATETTPAVVPETPANTPAPAPAEKTDTSSKAKAKASKKTATKPSLSPEAAAQHKTFHETIVKLCAANDLHGVLDLCGMVSIGWGRWASNQYCVMSDNILRYIENRHGIPAGLPAQDLGADHTGRDICITLVNVADDASLRQVSIRIRLLTLETRSSRYNVDYVVRGMTAEALREVKKYDPFATVVQDEAQLKRILAKTRPWALPWLSEHQDYNIKTYVKHPWLETLEKASYDFAKSILTGCRYDNADIERINRLCQDGTKPKTIFKAEKCVYEALKNERCMSVWDVYRRMCKTGKLTKDTIVQAIERGLTERELELVSSILGATWQGRPCFTYVSLMNYLGRLDMYEAIDTRNALEILRDYLDMCRQLEMAPRIDGDSLKREHDIAARLVRQQRNEIEQRKMEEAKKKFEENKRFLEYHEGVYFIRPIFDYEELIDEATQQHNCVASYSSRIASGSTFVLQMRETAHPEKSLVTVELSPDLKTIRQKYLAYNQPIRNKSISDFLDRWHQHIKAAAAQSEKKTVETIEELAAIAA